MKKRAHSRQGLVLNSATNTVHVEACPNLGGVGRLLPLWDGQGEPKVCLLCLPDGIISE